MTAFAASTGSANTATPADLHVASKETSDSVDALAANHLSSMKQQFASTPAALGFDKAELSNAALGTAFTLYVFNENGQIVSDDTLVYPVIYDNEIVAVVE